MKRMFLVLMIISVGATVDAEPILGAHSNLATYACTSEDGSSTIMIQSEGDVLKIPKFKFPSVELNFGDQIGSPQRNDVLRFIDANAPELILNKREAADFGSRVKAINGLTVFVSFFFVKDFVSFEPDTSLFTSGQGKVVIDGQDVTFRWRALSLRMTCAKVM